MKTYLAVAIGTVFLSVLCSVLVPEGKLKKTVVFSLRMACMLALISPVLKIFNFGSSQSTEMCDYEFVCEAYSRSQEIAAEKEILEQYGENCECDIAIEYSDGQFRQTSVDVVTESGNSVTISLIYAYLEKSGYININVI